MDAPRKKGTRPLTAASQQDDDREPDDELLQKTRELEREIAERRQLEKELRQSEQRISGIIATAMDAIITIDHKQRIVLFNQAAETMFGCSSAEALGSSIDRLIPERFRASHAEHVAQFLASGATMRAMGRLLSLSGRRANGEEFPIEAAISKVLAGAEQLATVVVRDISARRAAEQALQESEARMLRLAQHDPLTSLPNRALLHEFAERLLAATRRSKAMAAILFVDLDRFKPINDTYGHNVGDAVLQEVARRLSACVRSEDVVGRLGGDEFVAVLAPIHSEEDAAKIAFHMLDRLGQPYRIEPIELHVSPSIGISLFPQDGSGVEQLLKCADAAMYTAKQQGRNNFQFFQPELNGRSDEALRIEQRLRKALKFGEFELYLQPMLSLSTGKIVAAEALIRWPAMAVPPERFIPVAEMAGFMQTLGSWILQEACRLRHQWQARGLPDFPVSVNVSAIQFRQRDFTRHLLEVLEQASLQPGDLELEITESMLINNLDEAVGMLSAIRKMGVSVALDDFGTGYSSLSYLTQLPIDIVKLDQSFVLNLGHDHRSAIVAASVINLSHSLGLEVVAEGIESDTALDFLKAHHCQQGQGFLFSRPLPAREFESWCRQQPA